MKIVCDECGAKYAIADEKVRGKVFKIRCKKCSNVIVVRGTAGEEEQASQPEQNETRTYDYAGYDNQQQDEAAAGGDAVWHLVVDQEQVGPLSIPEVQQRFAQGMIDRETYAWREGFDDWVPLGSLAEFANLGADAGAAEGDAAAGLFAGAAAAPGEDADQGSASDPFATQVAQAGGDAGGDLFSGAAASGGGGDGLFDGADEASANEKRLRGERNENSVLFSLGNLAALASETKPAAAAPSSSRGAAGGGSPAAGMAQSGGSEGSGLIDIRSLAGLYTDDKSGAGGQAGANPLGAIEPVSFPAQSSVLLPTAPASNTNNKTLYIVLGVAGSALVAVVGILIVVLTSGGQQPAVAAAPPVGQAEEAAKPGSPSGETAEATTPPSGGESEATAAGGDTEEADDEEEAGKEEAGKEEGRTAVAKKDDDKDDRRSSSRSGSSKPDRSDSKPDRRDSKPDRGDSKPDRGGSSGGSGKCMDEVGCLLADSPPPCCSKYSGGGSKRGGGGGGGGGSNSNLPERLDRGDITKGINGVRGRVSGCGSKHSGKGQVKVTVKVEPSGSVGGVSIKSAPNSGLGSCVAGAVKRARFAKTQKGGSFTYPFVF